MEIMEINADPFIDYVIAIPSYKRSNLLNRTTLKLLNDYKISPKIIYIFVANESEYNIYDAILEKGRYNKIIVGVQGMGAIRNFITDYFPEGKMIFFMDDDIRGIVRFPDKKRIETVDDLNSKIKDGFSRLKQSGLGLFGFYPVDNPYFMLKDEIRLGLSYIVGCMYGVINDRSLKVSLDDKEDYERSILSYLKYGSNLRYNWIAPTTNYYSEKGGMQEDRTYERIMRSAEFLAEKYPELCKIEMKKKSGYPEIRMSRRAIHKKHISHPD